MSKVQRKPSILDLKVSKIQNGAYQLFRKVQGASNEHSPLLCDIQIKVCTK